MTAASSRSDILNDSYFTTSLTTTAVGPEVTVATIETTATPQIPNGSVNWRNERLSEALFQLRTAEEVALEDDHVVRQDSLTANLSEFSPPTSALAYLGSWGASRRRRRRSSKRQNSKTTCLRVRPKRESRCRMMTNAVDEDTVSFAQLPNDASGVLPAKDDTGTVNNSGVNWAWDGGRRSISFAPSYLSRNSLRTSGHDGRLGTWREASASTTRAIETVSSITADGGNVDSFRTKPLTLIKVDSGTLF